MVINVMAAGTFKARCLKVMDEVRATRRPVTILKRGKPVARLVPVDEQRSGVLGCLSGVVRIVGDSLREVAPADNWRVW